LRGRGFFGVDLGLGKTWKISESQAVKFSWETFNVTNTTRLDVGSLQAFGNDGGVNLSFTNSVQFGSPLPVRIRCALMNWENGLLPKRHALVRQHYFFLKSGDRGLASPSREKNSSR